MTEIKPDNAASTATAKPFADPKVIIWLFTCCFMVFAMAVIGAITRLTESGLSMVEWRPLIGALPPLNHTQWERVFDLYRQTPEFKDYHNWMTLSDFQKIFFWEWFHRLWGRTIGLVYSLPLLYFWLRGMVPQGYKLKFIGLLALGGTQGLVGWWMVKSGLVDRPDVSHFRLATHLGLALLIYSFLFWTALSLRYKNAVHKSGTATPDLPASLQIPAMTQAQKRFTKALGFIALAFLATTITWGAFVAGLDAGKIYNSFPLMSGQFTPPESYNSYSLIEQQAWVQFFHRWIAITTGLVLLIFAVRMQAFGLGAMVFAQVALGITALLTVVWVPVAAMHQAGAIILLSLLLKILHRLTHQPAPKRKKAPHNTAPFKTLVVTLQKITLRWLTARQHRWMRPLPFCPLSYGRQKTLWPLKSKRPFQARSHRHEKSARVPIYLLAQYPAC